MSGQQLIVAASLLAADVLRLGDEVKCVSDAGADWLHLDIMDNHYVPNLSFGPSICQAIRPLTTLPLDVHLMTERVDTLVEVFADAGADILTFHPDVTPHAHRTASAIRQAGMQVGVALNPSVPISNLTHLLDSVDMVLLMMVNPGFCGQSFIRALLPKIEIMRRCIDESGLAIRLQVDGGINAETAAWCRSAGADTLVSGSGIFRADDYAQAISQLRGAGFQSA